MSRVALVGLACVFTGMALFAVWSGVVSRSAGNEVRRTSTLSDSYQTAARALAELEAIGLILIADPTNATVLEDFDPGVETILAAMREVKRLGDDSDRALVDALNERYMPELDVARRYFAALLMNEPFHEQIPDRDTVNELREQLIVPAAQRKAEAAEAFRLQQRAETLRLYVTLGVYAGGVALVAMLLLAFRRSRARELAAQIQIAQLTHAALTDSLTGLNNHRAFLDALESQVAGATGRCQAALALIDLDGFKETNDRSGHEHGDTVLRAFGELLVKMCTRDARAFRIGGDEFAMLLPRVTSDAALELIEALRLEAIQTISTSISAGITSIAEGDTDSRLAREQADWALYEAKKRGRNSVIVYENEDPSAIALLSGAKLQALRAVIANGSIEPYFQPIRAAVDGSLVAYEALARGFPGLAGPQEAFDLAERSHIVPELDRVCRASIVRAASALPREALLFMNVSPAALAHESFSAAQLEAQVRAAGLQPQQIVVEVTERSMIRADVVARIVGTLRQRGFRIALDDVGSGNAGLEMLRIVAVDFVKIDHSVVRSALSDPTGRAVMVAIVAYANEAGAQVIAEGIESDAMLDLVQNVAQAVPLHVGLVQGYYVGMPAASFQQGLTATKAA